MVCLLLVSSITGSSITKHQGQRIIIKLTLKRCLALKQIFAK